MEEGRSHGWVSARGSARLIHHEGTKHTKGLLNAGFVPFSVNVRSAPPCYTNGHDGEGVTSQRQGPLVYRSCAITRDFVIL